LKNRILKYVILKPHKHKFKLKKNQEIKNKKNMRKSILIITSITFIFLFISCSKTENNSLKQNKITSLKTYSLSENLKYISKYHNMAKENVPILKVRIGVERCHPGWGICSIEIFGTVIWNRVMPTVSTSDETVLLPIVEEENSSFVYILLNEDVSQYDPSELILVVDSDKIVYDSENKMIKILKGNYIYDSELGEFGGYKINIYNN